MFLFLYIIYKSYKNWESYPHYNHICNNHQIFNSEFINNPYPSYKINGYASLFLYKFFCLLLSLFLVIMGINSKDHFDKLCHQFMTYLLQFQKQKYGFCLMKEFSFLYSSKTGMIDFLINNKINILTLNAKSKISI